MPTARPSIDVGNALHLEQLAGAPAEAGGTETGADGSRLGKALLEDLVHGAPVLRRVHERHLILSTLAIDVRPFPGFPSSSPAHRRTAAARRPALRDAVRDTSPRCRRRTRDSPSGWDRPPVVCRASRMPPELPCSHPRKPSISTESGARGIIGDPSFPSITDAESIEIPDHPAGLDRELTFQFLTPPPPPPSLPLPPPPPLFSPLPFLPPPPPLPPLLPFLLEEELQHQLYRSRRAYRGRDRAEGVRRVDVGRGRTKARRVGQIERFGPELEVPRAARIKPLRQDEVQILVARRARDTNRTVAPACHVERVRTH